MNNIRSERVRLGITQEELAKRIETSPKTVSFWETGKNLPPMRKVMTLAKMFDCTTDYLLGMTDRR